MTEHPMQPSAELENEWIDEVLVSRKSGCQSVSRDHAYSCCLHVARRAYAAGADAELKACCDVIYLREDQPLCGGTAEWLRAARRPKPPSLKEQALNALDRLSRWNGDHEAEAFIRRALEAFPDES